jgi:hypothetical protein
VEDYCFWVLGILVCVILLISVLVTLFFRSFLEYDFRAEAISITHQMATTCGVFFREDGNTQKCTLQNSGIGVLEGGQALPPASCSPTHWFWYSVKDLGDSRISFEATRCTRGGKAPQNGKAYHIGLTVDYKCGTNFECAERYDDYNK